MKRLFALFVIFLMALPMLALLGVRDVGRLGGSEASPPDPAFELSKFRDGSWQRRVSEWFGKRFFGRTAAVRTANQIYEAFNFGQFHRGNAKYLKNLADGALIEEYYVTPYLEGRPVDATDSATAFQTIKRISDLLKPRGVDTVFVLAPDKVSGYRAGLPNYVKRLWRVRRGPPQTDFAAVLGRYGIRCFDACAHLMKRMDACREPMFSYGGVHWNALGVGIAVEELLDELNALSVGSRPYRFARLKGVERCEQEIYGDYDVAWLLNVWYNPIRARGESFRPIFADGSMEPGEGSALVFGDSFAGQFHAQLCNARAFAGEKIVLCDKRAVTSAELAHIMPDLRLLVFVYQPPYCYVLEQAFGPILRQLEADLRAHLLPESAYSLGDASVFVSGFSFLERRPDGGSHVWTEGPTAHLRLVLPEPLRGKPATVALTVSGLSLKGRLDYQRVGVSINGGAETEHKVAERRILEVPVPETVTATGTVELSLSLPDAVTPKSLGMGEDSRKLALMFEKVDVR